ncbi:hypothetical protein [Caballeronia arvi]|uniref:hypothetical protein n=1 Tax=Caballeronia arvi TaxID=1777135 RepID=UPI001F37AE21|nr:hypothetical protein [Caballeronia arvi]
MQFGAHGVIQASRRARRHDHVDLATLKRRCRLGPIVEASCVERHAQRFLDFRERHSRRFQRRVRGTFSLDHAHDDRLQRVQIAALGIVELECDCCAIRIRVGRGDSLCGAGGNARLGGVTIKRREKPEKKQATR